MSKVTSKAMVFIGSPFSQPSVTHNVNRAAMEYDWLWQTHKDRVIPVSMVVSSAYQDMIVPRGYDEWLDLCIDMMKRCDIYYALPGKSSGMEKEIAICNVMGIPVVRSREELEKYLETHPELFDGDIARIRREIGAQLYEASRKGVDMAKIRAGGARRFAAIVLGEGAKFLGKQALDFAAGNKKKSDE